MKKIKYIFLIVVFAFCLKGFAPIFNLEASTNIIVDELMINPSDIEHLQIDVNNANISLEYAEVSDISIISKLTDYQKQVIKYSLINQNQDKTGLVSEYRENKFINNLNSYGNISILVPKNYKFKTINIDINDGTINSNIQVENYNINGNSLKANIANKIDNLKFFQYDGSVSLSQANFKNYEINQNNGEIYLKNITSDTGKIIGGKYVNLTANDIYANQLDLQNKFHTIDFEQMKNINYQIDNANVLTSNLANHSYQKISDEINTMVINGNGVTIEHFEIIGD